jgi:hypothetical protein
MNAGPKFKRPAEFGQQSVENVATILTSNVAPSSIHSVVEFFS